MSQHYKSEALNNFIQFSRQNPTKTKSSTLISTLLSEKFNNFVKFLT